MPTPFQMSSSARFMMQELRKTEIGATVAYEVLAHAAGIRVDDKNFWGALTTARRSLLREEKMVFGIVRREGVKRLDDSEIVGTSAHTAQKIKRAARRGVNTLTAVNDFSKLTREDQMRHSASVSVFGAIAQMSTERSLSRIEAKVADERKQLPFKDTLAAFKK